MITIYGLDLTQWYPYRNYIESEYDIDIYCDTTIYHSNSNKKIYIQSEPYVIYDCRPYLSAYSDRFDYILCHDPSTFGNTDKFIEYMPAACWIERDLYMNIDTTKKAFKISSLTGHKSYAPGHKVRHQIYNNQTAFSQFPIVFYRSSAKPHIVEINNNPFISNASMSAKVELFETFQYSIVIENVREINGITEKLIDCLITKTIPIYYGCPNVSKFFNTEGWIILETGNIVDELQTKLPILNESYYSKYEAVIEENYKKAQNYSSYTINLLNGLEKVPFIVRLPA
jgi:hypothetical protein